jgi:hypothetical protein
MQPNLWEQDIGKVSQFLNIASTLSDSDFNDQATAALMSETDELTQKQVLDNALSRNPSAYAANSTLVGKGTFAQVISLLQEDMASNGTLHVGDVNTINAVRCTSMHILQRRPRWFRAVCSSMLCFL